MQTTANQRTNNPFHPRTSLFSLRNIDFKNKISESIIKKQKLRRKEIFKAFRTRKIELEKSNQFSEEEVHEKLRQEFLEELRQKEREEEAEIQEFGLLNTENEIQEIDEILEMEKEEQENEEILLCEEAEYFEMLERQAKEERNIYDEECTQTNSPPRKIQFQNQNFEENHSENCPICGNSLISNSKIIICETEG